MAGGGYGRSDEEFIELYNPTENVIDLTGWSLKRLSSFTSTSTQNLVSGFSTSTIAAKGFFLIASPEDSSTSTIPDLRYNRSYHLANEEDVAILVNNLGEEVDRLAYQSIEGGKSLERKAWQNNSCVSAQGDGEFLGNGCDTDSATDFEIRQTPNPQNSQSLAEPRSAPTAPSVFFTYTPSNPKAGDLITFNAVSSSDPDGQIVSYQWNFGDGDNASTTVVIINHSYLSAGIYLAQLTVFDNQNTSSTTSANISVAVQQNNYNDTFISITTSTVISQLDKSIGLACPMNNYGNICPLNYQNYQDLGSGLSGVVRKITINMAINTDTISNFSPYLYDITATTTTSYSSENLQFSEEMAYVQRDYTFDFGRPIPLDATHQYQIRFSYGSWYGNGFQIFGSANPDSYSNGDWQTDSAMKDAYFILEAAKSRVLPEAPREQTFVDNNPVNFTGAYDNLNNLDKIRFVITELNSSSTIIKDFDIPQSSNSIAVSYNFDILLANGNYQYYVFLYNGNTKEASDYSDVFNFQITDRPQNALVFQLYKGTAVNCPLNSYFIFCLHPVPYFQDLGNNLSGQLDSIVINARVDVATSGVSHFSVTLSDLTTSITYTSSSTVPESFVQRDYDFKLEPSVILDSNHQYRIQINFGSWSGDGLVIFGSNNSNSYSAGSWGGNQYSDEKLKDIYFILTTSASP